MKKQSLMVLVICTIFISFAIGYASSSLMLKKEMSDRYGSEGWKKYWEQDYKGALEAFESKIKGDSDDYYKITGIGWSLYGLGDLDGAILKFNEAIHLAPRSYYAYSGLGWIYLEKGEFELASEAFEIAAKNPPYSYSPHYGKGWAEFALGKAEESNDKKMAIAHYRKAADSFSRSLDYDPSLDSAYYWLARSQIKIALLSNETMILEDAKKNALRAVELNDANHTRTLLGWFTEGRFKAG